MVWYRSIFAMDTRAIALMRIAVSLCILWDLCIRAGDLQWFYTDNGLLPVSFWNRFVDSPYHVSVHAWLGSKWFISTLFVLHFVAAFCLLFGCFTRMANALCLLLLISLNNRNPYIIQGGDEYLRLALFWMLFLPLDRHYSIRKSKTVLREYCSPATAGLLLLIVSVYFFSALQKTSAEWHSEGGALYYALSLDQIVRPVGQWLYPHENVLYILTKLSWYFEFAFGFLILIPWEQSLSRSIFYIGVLLFHCGIALLLFVGLFPIICMSIALCTLPGYWLDKFDKFVYKRRCVFGWISEMGKRAMQLLPKGFGKPVYGLQLNLRRRGWRHLRSTFLLGIIVLCLLWNVGTVHGLPDAVVRKLKPVVETMELHQDWGMFSPGVFKDDGWMVLEGILENGDRIEINGHEELLKRQKPEYVLAYIKNDRWRKYMENYCHASNTKIRHLYCRAALEHHNRNHKNQLDSLGIYYVKETSLPHYKTAALQNDKLCGCTKNNK